ncbi:helix-turn-helix domain-containing protein [Sulfurimonas sp. SAG-AH-194-C21]|nr:helix-turn-helix domain-containing protein [Sulfurimonas sp. SAG-AH-194-C21]MDF1884455.1 helix-turn-helix domain-containing protein [Sulfurimonas sp. SAG-AH-194-C21]
MNIKDTDTLDKLAYIKDNGKTKQERQRAHAILLSNDGITKSEIANIFGVSIRSIFTWLKAYKDDGVSSLKCKSGRGRKSLLYSTEHKKIVAKNIELFAHQPKKAFAMTVDETGIKLSYDTFKYFLKKHSI